MKRVLIYILLLANFGAGLAFAWDSNPEGMASYDTVGLIGQQLQVMIILMMTCSMWIIVVTVRLIFSQNTLFVACSHYEFFMLSRTPNLLYLSPLLR